MGAAIKPKASVQQHHNLSIGVPKQMHHYLCWQQTSKPSACANRHVSCTHVPCMIPSVRMPSAVPSNAANARFYILVPATGHQPQDGRCGDQRWCSKKRAKLHHQASNHIIHFRLSLCVCVGVITAQRKDINGPNHTATGFPPSRCRVLCLHCSKNAGFHAVAPCGRLRRGTCLP